MLGHKKCSILALSVLFVSIQILQETTGTDWNKECCNKNECYKLLENGKKFTWPEAQELCRKEQGYLIDETWNTTTEKTEKCKLLKRLVSGSDIWTSLKLVNGYIQAVSKYTSYVQSAEELWETQPVWSEDTCIKLNKNKLSLAKCSDKLSVICTSDLEEVSKQVSDCNIHLKPILTAKVAGKTVNVQNGHIELKKEDRENVIFYCEGLESKTRIDWIKDGVYLKRRIDTIHLSITVDPSKIGNTNYSMQGTYWCETRSPGCSQKFSSNKLNLTFEGIITIHLHLKFNINDILSDPEVTTKLNESFQLCGTKRSINSDIRRGYTNYRNNMIATYNIYMYIDNNNMSCDADRYISEAGKQLSVIGVVDYGISFLPVCLRKSSAWQQSAQITCGNSTNGECKACPQHFTLLKPYCVRVTKPRSWITAYQDCFLTGIEKTPLDAKSFWMDANSLDSLMCFLKEQHIRYIWLAAERKLDGGPLYYSGPARSDFNYSFNETGEYNISWIESDYSVNSKCLALKIDQKKLRVLSCEDTHPFVCLFPSEFWTRNITYDSFHTCHANCSENFTLEGGIPWRDAREKCRQNDSDLIHKKSSYFINYEGTYNSRLNTNYIGKHNSEKPNSDTSLQLKFSQWLGADVQRVYHTYNTTFNFESTNENPKEYACLPGQNLLAPKVYIDEENEGNYIINMYDLEEASYTYGIKCYLNGKCVKSDKLSRLTITQQGYLFCEVLTHLPILLLKSNVILVQNPKIVTFACKIFDPNQTYDFKLHDFSFHNGSEGSISYYRKLLKEKLSEFEVSIQNISASSNPPGIYIDFHIEISSHESKLEEMYVNISKVIFQRGKEVEIGTRKYYVSYLRSTKYCMREIMKVEPNTSNCTSATWPVTVINKEVLTLQRCVTYENKILSRSCMGNFNTGAKWGPIEKLCFSPSQNSREEFYMCEDILHAARELINQTIELIERNESKSLRTYNTTNKFIRNFENLLIGKNVNGTYVGSNGSVSIYSMSLQHDVMGFMYKENGKRMINKAAENIETEENVTVAIYLTPNITVEYKYDVPILISVFENSIFFPKMTDNLNLNSPVVLIDVTDERSITFPIKLFFNPEINIESNTDHTCAFWNEGTNKWDEKGSRYNGTTSTGLHECLYYHLSSFALVFRADDREHFAILDILSRVGCYLSLFGLALVLLTFLIFPGWRTLVDTKIIASLSLSLFVMYLVFVTGFTQTSNQFVCIGIAATLHYFILASFCWMFVEAFHNYLKFVKVIGTYIPRFMWKASACAWGFPLIPVIAGLCYNYELYKDEQYCWVHSETFYFALLTPLAIICGANVVIFILIIISTTCARQRLKTNQQQYSLLISQLKMSFCVFMLLGLSWIFGFLTLTKAGVIFSYLFCITSTLQGFVIFVFFILLGKRAKVIWQKLFCQCYDASNFIMKDISIGKTQTSNLDSSSQTPL